MTTTVTVAAHCADDKQVDVSILNGQGDIVERLTMKDGETVDKVVYDDLSIIVRESEVV